VKDTLKQEVKMKSNRLSRVCLIFGDTILEAIPEPFKPALSWAATELMAAYQRALVVFGGMNKELEKVYITPSAGNYWLPENNSRDYLTK